MSYFIPIITFLQPGTVGIRGGHRSPDIEREVYSPIREHDAVPAYSDCDRMR